MPGTWPDRIFAPYSFSIFWATEQATLPAVTLMTTGALAAVRAVPIAERRSLAKGLSLFAIYSALYAATLIDAPVVSFWVADETARTIELRTWSD